MAIVIQSIKVKKKKLEPNLSDLGHFFSNVTEMDRSGVRNPYFYFI